MKNLLRLKSKHEGLQGDEATGDGGEGCAKETRKPILLRSTKEGKSDMGVRSGGTRNREGRPWHGRRAAMAKYDRRSIHPNSSSSCAKMSKVSSKPLSSTSLHQDTQGRDERPVGGWSDPGGLKKARRCHSTPGFNLLRTSPTKENSVQLHDTRAIQLSNKEIYSKKETHLFL